MREAIVTTAVRWMGGLANPESARSLTSVSTIVVSVSTVMVWNMLSLSCTCNFARYFSLVLRNLDNLRDIEREAEGSGDVVFEKDAENFVDGEKE